MGTPCRSGVTFYLPVSDLKNFEKDYQALVTAKQNTAKEITNILNGGSSIETANGLSVGQELPVPSWQWVDVQNSAVQRFRDGTQLLQRDDTCGISEGGKIKILGFLSDQETALLSYTAPRPQVGTPCPSGVIFLSDSKKLKNYSEAYESVLTKRAALVAAIQSILSGQSQQQSLGSFVVGQSIKVRSWSWQTVAVETTQTFINATSKLAFEDSCGMVEGGIVTILGFFPTRHER